MRWRITLLVAATTSLVLLAFLVPLALLVRDVAATRAVATSTVRAQSLAPVVAGGDRRTVEVAVQQMQSWSDSPLTVLWPDGTTTGAAAPRDPAIELATRGRSLTVDARGGQEILVAVQGGPGGTAVIRSFVPDQRLRRGVARAWTILALLGVGLLAFALLVADRLARSLVRQITALARLSHRLSRGELDARVPVAGPPEIRDVGAGLNHLATRIEDLLAGEREAAADLSHRLRTPLTALRLEAEALRDPHEAERLTNSVDALERTVTQLIKQTRQPARHGGTSCDAAEIVTDRVAFWSVLADEQNREVNLTIPAHPVPSAVGGEDLSACVDALLGNVFAHTSEGTALAVTLEAPDPGVPGSPVRLIVSDDGPGFRDGSLLNRGTSTAASSGLGLDIARRIAESSGRALYLGTSASGGAQVLVELGTPPARP